MKNLVRAGAAWAVIAAVAGSILLAAGGAAEACTASSAVDTARETRGRDSYKVARDVASETLDTHRYVELKKDATGTDTVTIEIKKTDLTMEAAIGTILSEFGGRDGRTPTHQEARDVLDRIVMTKESLASRPGAWRPEVTASDMEVLSREYVNRNTIMSKDWKGNAHGPIVSTDGNFRVRDHIMVHVMPFNDDQLGPASRWRGSPAPAAPPASRPPVSSAPRPSSPPSAPPANSPAPSAPVVAPPAAPPAPVPSIDHAG